MRFRGHETVSIGSRVRVNDASFDKEGIVEVFIKTVLP